VYHDYIYLIGQHDVYDHIDPVEYDIMTISELTGFRGSACAYSNGPAD
jgi:hypothetical protein